MLAVMVCAPAVSAERVWTHAGESAAMPEFTLSGDSRPTKVSVLWEMDLENRDGNQNQVSMAKCGGVIYVCVSHYEDLREDRTKGLFLRRFSAQTGETLGDLCVELPAGFTAGQIDRSHTVASDDNGDLIAAIIRRNSATGLAGISLRRVIVDGDVACLDEATAVDFDIPNLPTAQDLEPWMERIDGFTGSFAEGRFSFRTTLTVFNGAQSVYYNYHIDYDASRKSPCSATPLRFVFDNTIVNDNSFPDVAAIPGSVNRHVVTLSAFDNTSTARLYSPTIFEEGVSTGNTLAMHGWHTVTGADACRGFYPFVHNGHTLAVYSAFHSDRHGSRFRMISLPDGDVFDNAVPLCELPTGDAFPTGGADRPVYMRKYRQLAIAEPAGTTVRDRTGSVTTRLYTCAPGSGIGAYELYTPSGSTGITEPSADADSPVMRLSGRTLAVDYNGNQDSCTALEIFDTTGRLVHSICPVLSANDLSCLPAGVYLVRLGDRALRLALR